MRIGVDARCLQESEYSGVSNYTNQLLQSMFEIDSVNQYFLYANSFRKTDSFPEYEFNNVQLVASKFPNKLINSSIILFNRPNLDSFLPAVDLFWSPANNFVSWSGRAKRVITCHDLSWKIFPRFYSCKGKVWHKLIKIDNLFAIADLILSVSEYTKEDLLRFYPDWVEKIVVTPLGVNSRVLGSKEIREVAEHFSLPDKYIFYLGNIEPRKNLKMVLEAYQALEKKYPDLHLVIAGGSGWHRRYYQKIISRIKKIPRARYFGYVSEQQRLVLLKKAAVFFFPSFYEGFGLPVLEAMSQDCPVVASNVSALPEVVGSAGLLIDPYNVSQAVWALEKVLLDNEWRERIVVEGRKRVAEYSWEKTAKKTLRAFEKIAR